MTPPIVQGSSRPPHAPKTAALLALCEGVLSEAGRRRIERHLAGCEVCRRHLAAIRLVEDLREDVVSLEPELDWDRLELPLRREARRVARLARARRLAPLALSAVAAAAALALFLPRGADAPPLATAPTQPHPPSLSAAPAAQSGEASPKPPPSAPLAQVVAVTGEASASISGAPRHRILAGETLATGTVLQTGPESSVHVWLRADTGFLIGPDTRLVLLSLGEHVLLELQHGEVHSRVAPLGPAQRYEVSDGAGWVAHVRGTRFAVRRLEEGLAVDVQEGKVEITRGGQRLAMLAAPAAWRPASEDSSPRNTPVPAEPAVLLPWLPAGEDPSAWSLLLLPSVRGIEGWEVEGLRSTGPLQLRRSRGTVTVYALGREQRRVPLRITLDDARVRPDAATIEGLASKLLNPRRGRIDPHALASAARKLGPALQRCHRRALKERPTLAERSPIHLVARLRIGLSGSVRSIRWKERSLDAELSDSLLTCLRDAISSHPFPRPEGEAVLVDLPIRLAAR